MSEMKAGRELDAAIAEVVFGFKREKSPKDCDGKFGGTDVLVPPGIDHAFWQYPPKGEIGLTFWVPKYSTDLQECQRLKQWITVQRGLVLMAETDAFGCHAWAWTDKNVSGKGTTEPEAIALLALAVAQEQPR